MTSDVELEGADRLVSGLNGLADRLEEWPALRQVAEDWRDRAQRRAPKVSGRLASSLSVRSAGADWEVHSPLPYARVIHNGWSGRNIRANPFLANTNDPGAAAEVLADDLATAMSHLGGA